MRINASYGGWSGRCPGWHHLHPRLCCGDSVRGTGARRTRGGDHEASRRQGGAHGGGWPLPGGPHLVGSPTSSPCIVLLGRLDECCEVFMPTVPRFGREDDPAAG